MFLLLKEPSLLDCQVVFHTFSLLSPDSSWPIFPHLSYILILETSPHPLGLVLAPLQSSTEIHTHTFSILSQLMVMCMLCMSEPPHLYLHSGPLTWPLGPEANNIKANGVEALGPSLARVPFRALGFDHMGYHFCKIHWRLYVMEICYDAESPALTLLLLSLRIGTAMSILKI